MEAARALHIEGFDQAGQIDVRGDSVTVEQLTIVDATLAALIERRQQDGIAPQETVSAAAEIGARVLDREATRAEVDFIERRFAELEHGFGDQARRITERLDEHLEKFFDEDSGEMGKRLDEHSSELADHLAELFGEGRSTAVQHQIRELTIQALTEQRKELLRQFSAEDGHNPLADFKGSIVRESKVNRDVVQGLSEEFAKLRMELQRVRDAQQAADELAVEHDRGTAKGRDFEDRAFSIVERMAAARGDVAHHVGDESTGSGSKKGDIVIEVDAATGPASARIVLELKDQRLTKQKAWELLDACLIDREADFALLVIGSDSKLPAGREELHEYQGDKMIVVLDRDDPDERGLFLAYAHARLRCMVATEEDLQLDAAGVRDAADQAFEALKAAQGIRNSLTKARKGVDGARDGLDAMVEQVDASLQRVQSLITASADPS